MAEHFKAKPVELVRVAGCVGHTFSREAGLAAQMDDARAGDCANAPGDMDSFWAQWFWVRDALKAQADWGNSKADGLEQAGKAIHASDQV
jgi:hypothetical protein